MAYRFNSGMGGITCDNCQILIDQGLSFKEYEELQKENKDDGDFCWRCKAGVQSLKDEMKAKLKEQFENGDKGDKDDS